MKQKHYVVRRCELRHSAKGSTWKDHKYIKKVGDKYVYADTPDVSSEDEKNKKEQEGSAVEGNTEGVDKATDTEFDLEEMATKVIRGEFGNGADRKELLGDSYAEIQKRVNEILLGNGKTKVSSISSKETKETKETDSSSSDADKKK
jgi:hypothetical protein